MKYFRFMLFLAAVLALSTAAYAQQSIVRASVPFNFMVGDKLYPAGDYSVANISIGSPVLQIKNDEQSSLILTSACSGPKGKSEQTKLIFERVGGVYFLHQIWVASNQVGRELRPTPPKEITLAHNSAAPKEVVVAAYLTQR
jgi:hypothetical protein